MNPINEKDSKCSQYVVTVTLNHEEIGKHSERIKKIKPLVNKYNSEGINFPSENDGCKKFEKTSQTTSLEVSLLKRKKYILLMFQNITQIVRIKFFF